VRARWGHVRHVQQQVVVVAVAAPDGEAQVVQIIGQTRQALQVHDQAASTSCVVVLLTGDAEQVSLVVVLDRAVRARPDQAVAGNGPPRDDEAAGDDAAERSRLLAHPATVGPSMSSASAAASMLNPVENISGNTTRSVCPSRPRKCAASRWRLPPGPATAARSARGSRAGVCFIAFLRWRRAATAARRRHRGSRRSWQSRSATPARLRALREKTETGMAATPASRATARELHVRQVAHGRIVASWK